MAKYTESFKIMCVDKLTLLKEVGIINIDGIQIKNVRELVEFFGISSYTLYQWNKVFKGIVKKNQIKTKPKSKVLAQLENELDLIITQNGIEDAKGKGDVKFGIGFWMFVARNMGIPNYRKFKNLKQLKLRIGTELINSTGLVNPKAKKGLKL